MPTLQANLFDNRTIQVRFDEYHREHPEVYGLFKALALRLLNAGRAHYGSDAIIQVIRFEHAIKADAGQFKINDHFSSRYARLLMSEDLRFQGFFELRQLKSA